MTDWTCSICKKPILDGEPRYTAGEHKGIFRHWDCYAPELKKIDDVMALMVGDRKKIRILTGVRKSPVRAGDGPVAKRLGIKLAAAIKRELDLDVDPKDLKFWVQPPEYRGPRWDLAVWGCTVTHPDSPNRMLSFHSWDTMTRLVKAKELKIVSDGLDYDVGA